MKTGADAVGTAENEFRCARYEQDPTPSVPPKTSPRAQNIKTGLDALGTAENEYGHQNHETETRFPSEAPKTSPGNKT
jgi:hypothetical protein